MNGWSKASNTSDLTNIQPKPLALTSNRSDWSLISSRVSVPPFNEPHAKLLKELVEAKSHGAYNAVVRGMVEKIGDKQFFKDHPKALDSAKVVIVGACIFIAFSDGIVSDTLYDTGAIEQEDSSSEDIPDADATTENLGAVAGEAQGLTDADKKRMPPAEGAKRKWWQKK